MDKKETINLLISSKENEVVMIDPTLLLGWRENKSVDFKIYEDIGLPHPKDNEYYDSLNNIVPDIEIWTIYKSILEKEKLDDPICVFVHGEEIVILDGATRVTCIAFVKKTKPKIFKTIPVVLFRGDMPAARGEMLRRNLESRNRFIKDYEMMEAIGLLSKKTNNEFEINKLAGIDNRPGLARKCILVYNQAIQEVKDLFRINKINLDQATSLSRLTPAEQFEYVKNIESGNKVRIKKRKKAISVGKEVKFVERKLDLLSEMHPNDKVIMDRIKKIYHGIHVIEIKVKNARMFRG